MNAMALEDPTPISASRAGCAAHIRRGEGQWTNCKATPTHVGTYTYQHPRRSTDVAFACTTHAQLLDNARAMTPYDQEALARRRAIA